MRWEMSTQAKILNLTYSFVNASSVLVKYINAGNVNISEAAASGDNAAISSLSLAWKGNAACGQSAGLGSCRCKAKPVGRGGVTTVIRCPRAYGPMDVHACDRCRNNLPIAVAVHALIRFTQFIMDYYMMCCRPNASEFVPIKAVPCMRFPLVLARCIIRRMTNSSALYIKSIFVRPHLKMPVDLLHPTAESEARTHKLKRLVQSPNSFFMDIKCPGCFQITTVFSHAQTVVLCGSCNVMLCQPTGGRARLTEGCSYRKKVD
ncbi:hypothetical protein HJC23_010018 [Cyclotella cryptica]|uniref:40S ribosomal protein S27 n=1 Tax=Cyclotella cryptica TaxID=29204 RepID=A0ABD3Q8L7_9STRA